jgi:uncharacterized protein
MFQSQFRNLILQIAEPYYQSLAHDFSHDKNHFLRVESIAKQIGEKENADLIVLEASALLFDIARELEDKGEINDHSEKASEIAEIELGKIDFPKNKIENVKHSIYVHRRSKDREPKTLEAKILRDADYLDAMGAIDIARVIASSLTSKKYSRPIYDGQELGDGNEYQSALHFFQYKLKHTKHNPENFYTEEGRRIARIRHEYSKKFIEQFLSEWVS